MSKQNWLGKFLIMGAVVAVIFAYFYWDLGQHLSFENLKAHQAALAQFYSDQPWVVVAIFITIYILITAISLPGATILTLGGGAIFGFWPGLVLVSIASTVGATLAFLVSRFFLQDFVQNKFGDKLKKINEGVKKEGALYLFTLRLVPLFPFFLINLTMGLTPIRTLTYFFVSQIGMLPGTAVYVNAGTQLAQISSLKDILSMSLILSFVLIGILPLLLKWVIDSIKSPQRKFKKPKKFDYNLVVIGGGSAGLVSAYIAAAVKAKVALIEKHKMGGDCLNTGCVPSKALIRSAKILNYFGRAEEFGFDATKPKVDFAKVMKRVQAVIQEIAPHDSIERYSSLGVDCISDQAKIKSPFEIEISGKTITTKTIVIASGAKPFVPPIPGLKDISYLTSDNVWNLKSLPQRLVILGGGPIGCELAQCFARFGASVSLVEMSPRILAREDEDVSQFVTKKFTDEGISVLTNHKAKQVDANAKVLICEHHGQDIRIEFDEILIALGRRANVSGFGLEELGVEISNRGTIVADEFMRTNYKNIFVCGDVTGPYQFTHTAAHQAWYASVNAIFSPFKKFKVDYRVIPWCTFTDPEVARVGLNELEAREKGIPFEISRYDIDDLDRAITEGEAQGFVKVLTKPGSDKILGATIIGDHAGDIIAEYVTAMKYNIGLNKILGSIHIYPTLAEANKYAAGVWKKQNAPQKILRLLSKFHAWRRA